MAEARTKRAGKKRGGGLKGLLKKPAVGKGRGGQGLLDKPVGEVEVPLDDEILALGKEIRTLKEEARADSVMAQMEIGERLTRAHKRLRHGQWERFLQQEAGYKRMTAGKLVRLAQWGNHNRRALHRVKHMGLTKVYSMMAAPAEVLRQLLTRPWHAVPGSNQKRRLSQLSVSELDMVLRVLGGEPPEDVMTADAKAHKALAELERDAKRVVRSTNKLLKLQGDLPDAAAAAAKVAEARKRLLRSLKKLDKAFDFVD